MPRIPPSLLRTAFRTSPHAAALLPACRDLPSAFLELRWIREHAGTLVPAAGSSQDALVAALVRRRARGEPLQYVLGTQPFGELEIACRRGVLIPRPETEAYAVHLASLVRGRRLPSLHDRTTTEGLRILDLCTGTGCIPLLLASRLLSRRRGTTTPEVHGVDVSPAAVRLARHNAAALASLPIPVPFVRFHRLDLFSPDDDEIATVVPGPWDIMTCNPPYISRLGFARDTARAVRNHEPVAANVPTLVPAGEPARRGCLPQDVFYARVLELAGTVLRPRVLLFEVGDLYQAGRVAGLALRGVGEHDARVEVEIWRDMPDVVADDDEVTSLDVGGRTVAVKGSGHGRAVLVQYFWSKDETEQR